MLAGLLSRRRLVWAGIVALVLVLLAPLSAQTAKFDAASTGDSTEKNPAAVATTSWHTNLGSVPAETDRAIPTDSPLIIVGVGGLIWPNISPENTPTLWQLLEDPTTSAGAVTVHTVGQPVCPAGGWLALSSGRPTPSPKLGSLCVDPYRTRPAGEGGNVVDWEQVKESLATTSFEPQLGALREMLDESGVAAGAIGRGAALTLADGTGWVSDFSRTITPDSFTNPLTIVDAGSTSAEDLSGLSMRVVDARIRRVLNSAPDDATILISSVSAPEGARVQLGVALLKEPGREVGRYLTSTATRWNGVIRLLDLPPTIAERYDIPRPTAFGGAPLRLGSERPGAADTIETLSDLSIKDLTMRRMSGPVSGLLEVSTFFLVLFLIWCPWDSRHTSWRTISKQLETSSRNWVTKLYRGWRATRQWVSENLKTERVLAGVKARPRILQSARTIGIFSALFFAMLPVSLYLMGAIPWWDLGDPGLGAWLTLIGFSAVLGGLVAVLPWRSPWQAIGVIALFSAAVMAVDVIIGSPLHRGSPMGPSPIFGGRFYGFGNTTYSFFVVHTIIFAAVVAAPLTHAGRKFFSYLVVGGIGAAAVVVDVAPTWGADIGGGLALIPAFAFLAMALNRARFTVLRVLIIGGLTAGAILGFAYLDWLRPAARRSHAGQFFEQLITGDAWQVIWRKAQYALNTLDTGMASRLTLVLLALIILALVWPSRFASAPLRDALGLYAPLRVTLAAVLVGLIAGAGLNDYGLRIVSLGFATVAPLLALLTTRRALPRAKTRQQLSDQ